jgi:hypothetical protein
MRLKEELRTRAEVRKWGHSLGIIIPATIAKKLTLREFEKVELRVKKTDNPMELFGALKFKEPTEKIKKELKEGWGD